MLHPVNIANPHTSSVWSHSHSLMVSLLRLRFPKILAERGRLWRGGGCEKINTGCLSSYNSELVPLD